MVVADLHVHTTNSDGQLDLEAVPAAARAAGAGAVAVTDHDRVHPELPPVAAECDGVRLIHGIELRVEAPRERVDLLGYGVDPTPELERELERLQADRVKRGRAIIENVEAHLGVELDLEPREGLGRPHVARATAAATGLTVDDVFAELIGDDGPCFVARDVPSFETGRRLLSGACGLVSLAHPFRYDEPAGALELCADLDGVERHYPYCRDVDEGLLDDAIDRYDLVPTGGSDAHDDRFGLAGLDAAAYDRFRAAAGL
jgi:predicted metal-dependent phosphoesterase TrpH